METEQINSTEAPEILKNFSRDDIKLRYSLQTKLSKIPRPVLNRRYKKLQQLIDEDEYFGEDSIRERDPIMYFLYVGRYKRELAKEQESVAEMLMQQMVNNELEEELQIALKKCGFKKDINFDEPEDLPKEVLEDNIDELVRIMHDKFVAGGDAKFINYAEIDNNEELDDEALINRDAEDNYFDEEIGDIQETAGTSHDTGVQDY